MNCRTCELMQADRGVTSYYRLGNAKLEIRGCAEHLKEAFHKLNCHDDLVAACEKGLEICDVIDGLLATDEQTEAVVEAMKRPIKAALAKAEKKQEKIKKVLDKP